MIREVITVLLPLLLPAVTFFLWVRLRNAYIRHNGGEVPPVERGVWFWLALAGGVLLLVWLALSALLAPGGRPGDAYVPPMLIDGKIVPGHSEPRVPR
ncbi:DUF6111 family protein [Insolitispirillum peregrinum]|uniref:DUF6111 family protein n=1 Tax=Insolitispirillum peregrinum TaxID=80876 RepID=UPI003623A4BE